MRTLKLALAAVAAFAFHANAQTTPEAVTGMTGGGVGPPPAGLYQPPVVTGSAPASQAFHAGGVASCDGCHVMHNATNGQAKSTASGSAISPWQGVTNMYLLQGSDQSSTCLICHSGAEAPTAETQFVVLDRQNLADPTVAPRNFTPAGDFGWLQKTWKNSPGQGHGHSVAAADFGLTAETARVAPGGSWTNGPGRRQFACSSCHDPHGRYRVQQSGTAEVFVGPGSNGLLPANALPIGATGTYGQAPVAGTYAVGAYRLLAGQFYAPISNSSSPFANDPPVAVAPMTYNRAAGEATSEMRVAYGTGMSEWCQNCHGSIHLDGYTSGVAGLKHPAGSDALFHATQINVYNSYLSSGRVGAPTDPYTSLVPFEQGRDVTRAVLTTNAGGAALSAGSQASVMCLSCHRAHASAFDSMVRWDQNATFLTDGTQFTEGVTAAAAPGAAGAARSTAVTAAGYYNRGVGTAAGQIGPYQRSLCNKCHGKD